MRKILVLGLLFLGAVTVANAQVLPSSADFTFQLSNTGDFLAVHRFDRKPSRRCRLTLVGRGQIGEGHVTDAIVLKQLRSARRRVTFEASSLPAVVIEQRGAIPRANLMVRSECGDTVIESNVFARYVRCGQAGTITGLQRNRVAIGRWLRLLGEAL